MNVGLTSIGLRASFEKKKQIQNPIYLLSSLIYYRAIQIRTQIDRTDLKLKSIRRESSSMTRQKVGEQAQLLHNSISARVEEKLNGCLTKMAMLKGLYIQDCVTITGDTLV